MAPIATDALVIGAGPVGLFAAFQLGLQGVCAVVVDALHQPGGQCAALYPDKPIYDIPGVPVCTGQELTRNLLRQLSPFKPGVYLGQQVSGLSRHSDGRWRVEACAAPGGASQADQAGWTFLAHTVLIAAGVGAFVPKEIKLEGLAAFAGRQMFYRLDTADGAGRSVLIVGGEDDAVAHAIALARPGPQQADRVTLVHRRDAMQASPEALAELSALRQAGRIHFQAGQVTGMQVEGGRLTGLTVHTPDDQVLTLPLDLLLVCLGLSPKLGPLVHWGLAMARKQLTVDTASFATSAPGIFAVGDVITYPGKKKLIVSGFHEATLAAFAAAALIHPEASGVLQYTTSSALLQQRLGVAPRA